MSKPTKPFLKPFSQTPAPAAEEDRGVSVSEITTFAVAAGMHPDDRAAFLAHACAGDDALRKRIEQRLAARTPAPVPAPAPAAAPSPAASATATPAPAPTPVPNAELQRIPEPHLAISQNQPAGMALVPMSASQLAAITAQRQNTFPWLTAVVLAVAAGAMGVFLMQEKDARHRADAATQQAAQRAETAAKEAADARAVAGKERETAAEQITAARTESEKLRATAEEQRQRADTATQQIALAKAEAERQRTALAAAGKDDAGSETGKAALAKAELERDAIRVTQKETVLAFADTLAKLATTQLDSSRFAEAEVSARRSLELRIMQSVPGWPLVESRALLGAALLQKNADAEAGREFAAAAADIEQLGTPINEADRARFTMAAKRIVQFYNATGRRKEGTEWKRKFDALARP
ncbi:MAG: hypothetical protein NTV08_05800 [Verrucomicrobia bacterium]|nr:hypothetical protein [Verrucomicrobiota bacterium]